MQKVPYGVKDAKVLMYLQYESATFRRAEQMAVGFIRKANCQEGLTHTTDTQETRGFFPAEVIS